MLHGSFLKAAVGQRLIDSRCTLAVLFINNRPLKWIYQSLEATRNIIATMTHGFPIYCSMGLKIVGARKS